MTNRELIDLLHRERRLDAEQWQQLFSTHSRDDLEYAMALAREITVNRFGKKIYFRGIVEFSNYCKNDCKIEPQHCRSLTIKVRTHQNNRSFHKSRERRLQFRRCRKPKGRVPETSLYKNLQIY